MFVDLEAGDLSVKDWRGDCVRPKTWPEFRDLVVFLAGDGHWINGQTILANGGYTTR